VGSRGIGRAIALRLARDGALVAINYANNDQAATETVATIEHAAARRLLSELPSAPKTKPSSCSETSIQGLHRFDVLVNNAAVGLPNG
jgi:3-oxoacyl-[acyl-carrier protein] reductase